MISANIDIANGFYDQSTALQGQHHTFYTGAAFHTHGSAMLWRFTSGIVGDGRRRARRGPPVSAASSW